jgi:hypothetical protein
VNLKSLIVAAAMAAVSVPSSAQTTAAATAAELAELRAQLAALQQRLAALEAAQIEQQEAIDQGSDNLARAVGESASSGWLARWQWRGDLRYRHDTVEQEYADSSRTRDRVRLRVGASARVNASTRVELQLVSGEAGDARSSNVTLGDSSSRKSMYFDLAYAEWMPTEQWRVSAGKMRQPWVRTQSFFHDGDVNPEGVAAQWQQAATGFFASTFAARIAERASLRDSDVLGLQFGHRDRFGDGSSYTVGVGYFDYRGVDQQDVTQSGSAGGFFGNSTTTSGCRSARAGQCLANDFNVVELLAEVQLRVADRPMTLFGNYAFNDALGSDAGKLDSAYSFGATLGRASASLPKSWELGLIYQLVEKDALFGQWVESDFAAGLTDSSGYALRGAYQVSPNARLQFTYMMTETHRDVGVALNGIGTVKRRDFDRLMIDMNWSF